MRIDVLTLFPEMFKGPMTESVIKRAIKKGVLEINVHNTREVATDKHKSVDDTPYGGGPGMVMRVDIADEALERVKSQSKQGKTRVILMTPQGQPFNQAKAEELSKYNNLIILCGRYEGYDERIRSLVDEEISIGDYVLIGGEVAAMAVIEATTRLIPGVLGKHESAMEESFSDGLLEYPQYTRPEEYKGMRVPDILLSGNHVEIAKWRKDQSISKTREKRPDLINPNFKI